MATTVEPQWIGRIPFGDAWAMQRAIFEEVVRNERPNTFLLCEHPDVITLGRNARNDSNLLVSREELAARGYEVFDIDRGGDVTYHGPGQLVGYPIIRLGDFREDLGWYMRTLEELVIHAIRAYGLEGEHRAGMSGVWCNDAKICAIGVRASRWATMHGFALNVTTDLSRFDPIIPCGISEYAVTSIAQESGSVPALEDVAREVVAVWDTVFAG
ncbi:MAG: lipoyl(octanoyl) transferase LipB [Bacteroidetes bacterium]|nr:lipoyl(octanoyl) transferase LipB [Bacteroidota bacterium]